MVWHSPKSGKEPFNRQMRKATRKIHSVSDALVNAKLFLALSDNTVWAEGLLVFYEIFKYLEDAMHRLKNTPVADMYIEGIDRTEAFEADLAYYLGKNWADKYEPRKEVVNYLQHLMQIEKDKPELLIAYIYHLYMGLLSGGQILRKKRSLTNSFWFWSTSNKNPKVGYAVTDFGPTSIYNLKKQIISSLNEIALSLDEETRQGILDESCMVFQLNNEVISTIPSASKVLFRKLSKLGLCLIIMFALLYFVLWKK